MDHSIGHLVQTDQAFDGSRLSRTVWSQETINASLGNMNVQVMKYLSFTERKIQSGSFDQWFVIQYNILIHMNLINMRCKLFSPAIWCGIPAQDLTLNSCSKITQILISLQSEEFIIIKNH
jgi:hypothetical protein